MKTLVFNGIRDVTEKDLAQKRYYQLLHEQTMWNIERERRNPGFKMFSWKKINHLINK
jgi:hypothetical protein